jgi:iron complex outermembrane receptor protein
MLRTLIYSLMLFAMSTALFAQQNIKTSLKGQIQTSDGKEAPFVTVVIKDTKYGTVTDAKGLFQLRNIPAGNHILQIRIVGYQAQDFPFEAAEGQSVVLPVIRIKEDAQALNEVLIKGNINKFDAKETD